MSVQETSEGASASAPPERYFTVWVEAPLRPVPFVCRRDGHDGEHLSSPPVPDNSDVVDTLPKGSRSLAYAQCRGAWVEHNGYWNDYWLLTTGPNGRTGWVSMVDVDEGANGAPKQSITPTRYEWTPVAGL